MLNWDIESGDWSIDNGILFSQSSLLYSNNSNNLIQTHDFFNIGATSSIVLNILPLING